MIKEKKVALMTWFSYHNYGTALQASALVDVVKNLGYDIDVIDYPTKSIPFDIKFKNKRDYIKKNIKRLYEKLFNLDEYNSSDRETLFLNYLEKRMTFTKKCATYPELQELNEQYDAFICGSDQIWSPLCFDEKYFLSFVKEQSKLVSYAPSLGVSKISNKVIEDKISTLASRFSHLSVREEQGAKILENITGKKVNVVLDPTLLLSKDSWDKYAQTSIKFDLVKGKYIIAYFLGGDRHKKAAIKLSKKLKMPIYFIPTTLKQKKSGNSISQDVGPAEFVWLIKNAGYVCTDSFHGTAFAINYNIPFTVYERFKHSDPRNQNSRIYNILKLLKLEDRLYSKNSDISDCNFTVANKILLEQRELSLNYLKIALSKATNRIESNKQYTPTTMCCGCGACAAICPKDAIDIKKDEEGFDSCYIDRTKCINCGLCGTVCAFNVVSSKDIKESKKLVAIKAKENLILSKSSSGGVGYLLAKWAINNGFEVVGCAYDNLNNKAKHIFINKEEDLQLIQGSKYIQSESSQAIKELVTIAKDKKVMFFGTPCQIASVDKLLLKTNRRDNAILVDLICHGTPSDLLWQKYLKEIEEKYKIGSNPQVVFRNKVSGWRKRTISIIGNGKKYSKLENKDDFYSLFKSGLCDMKACLDCPYRDKSSADIRLGDFWGNKFSKDKTGVSMVIINNDSGERIVENVKDELSLFEEYSVQEYFNVQKTKNEQYPIYREELLKEIKSDKPLRAIRRKYCSVYDFSDKMGKVVVKLKRVLKK